MRIAKTILICVLIAGVSIFGFVMLNNVCVALFDAWGLEIPNTDAREEQVQTIRDNFVYAFIVLAIMPPICEELFFRFAGVKLLRWVDVKRWWTVAVACVVIAAALLSVYLLNSWMLMIMILGIVIAAGLSVVLKKGENPRPLPDIYIIMITAVVFMLYHHSWAQTIYQLLMGIIFAVIYLRTKNIGWTIFIHFINNAFIVIYTGYGDLGAEGETALNFGNIALALFLAAAAVAMIYNLIKELPNEQKK